MAEVINVPADSLDPERDRSKDDEGENVDNNKKSTGDQPDASPPPPPPPPRRRDRDSRERRDTRDFDRRRGDYYDRNRSPPPLAPRDRDYKRGRGSPSPPPPYRERRGGHSPMRRSPPFQPYKRSRRDDAGYDGRRGSPRGGFGPADRRFGYDFPSGYDREMGARPGYLDDRPHGRYVGRASGVYPTGPSEKAGPVGYF